MESRVASNIVADSGSQFQGLSPRISESVPGKMQIRQNVRRETLLDERTWKTMSNHPEPYT